MEINIEQKINSVLDDNSVNILIEYGNKTNQVNQFLDYINAYKNEIIVKIDNELIKIDFKDILYFYCKDKENFCKTINNEYKIKSRLYEIEKFDKDFIRVSKNCVVNFKNAKCFDFGRIAQIVIKFANNDSVTVSRRKLKEVMEYLDERRI